MNKRSAISAIEKHGILLVYPLQNRPEPLSLWSTHWPRTKMKWEWNEDSDDRVSDLWQLRSELSTTRKVVYAKFYQGRATFFSREIFTALLALMHSADYKACKLKSDSKNIMELLDTTSPLSTKRIKKEADLKGKFHEASYTRALKELWNKLLIVGFGEVDDGAFPSLAVGSTELLFEDLWSEAKEIDLNEARITVIKKLGPQKSLLIWMKKHCGLTL